MTLSDAEKIRVLEKRVLKLEQLLGKGAFAQYLFCPSLNVWLPAQCDDEGRQVIDPADLDDRYLKVAGTNKMLANLDMNDKKIDNFGGLEITRAADTFLDIIDGALVFRAKKVILLEVARIDPSVPSFRISKMGDSTLMTGKTLVAKGKIDFAIYDGILRLATQAPSPLLSHECYFSTADDNFYVYNGTAWVSVALR